MQFSRHSSKNYSREEALDFYHGIISSGNLFFAIELVLGNSKKHIGNLTVYFDSLKRNADIGIMIGDEIYQGKGYAREAMSQVIKLLFFEYGVEKITCGMMDVNKPMVRLCTSLGMHYEKVISESVPFQDKIVKMVRYALESEK